MKIETISHSAQGNLHACPRKYYISNILRKRPEVPPTWGITGNLCHMAVGKFFQGTLDPFDSETWGCLDNKVNLALDECDEGYYVEAVKYGYYMALAIARVFARCKPAALPDLKELFAIMAMPGGKYEEKLEHKITIPFSSSGDSNLTIVGFADYFNATTLIDFKFLSSISESAIDNYMRSSQLHLYRELIRELFDVNITSMKFVLVPKVGRIKKLGTKDFGSMTPEGIITKLTIIFGTMFLDKLRVVDVPIADAFALEEIKFTAHQITQHFDDEEYFWKNDSNCKQMGGCGFQSVCWGFGDINELPNRTEG